MGVLRLSRRVRDCSRCWCSCRHPRIAQYFGRNKVEYTDFDFRILTTEHFDVYYYAREERAAQIAAQLAERWYSRISRVLHHQLERRQPLVIYGSQAEFAQTNVVSGLLPDSVGGVTESSRRRIVMPFAPTMAETDRVLGHEMVHAFQFDIARRHGGGIGPAAVVRRRDGRVSGARIGGCRVWALASRRGAQRTAASSSSRRGAAALALSIRPCLLVVSRQPVWRRGRREGAEAGQEASKGQRSDALRDGHGPRDAARRLASQRVSGVWRCRVVPIARSCGAEAACSSDRRSVPTASRRCSSPSAIGCRWTSSSPTSRTVA